MGNDALNKSGNDRQKKSLQNKESSVRSAVPQGRSDSKRGDTSKKRTSGILNFQAKSAVNRKLVEEAIQGDSDAVSKVIELYYKDILYFTISHIGNAQDGEDVAQQAITRIICGMNTLREPEKVKSWMMSIVHNDCMNYMKKNNRIKKLVVYEDEIDDDTLYAIEVADREFLPEEALLDEELRKQVLEVIGELPTNYSETLRLRYLMGLKNSEIAEVLEVNTKKIENDLSNAKKLFKKRFEEETGVKYSFSVVPVGAVPFLTQVFNDACESTITPEMAQRVLTAAQEQAVANMAAQGTSAPSLIKPRGPKNIGTIATVSVATVLVVGGVLIYALSQEPEAEPEPVPESITEVAPDPEPMEAPINTVADMIGEEESAVLAAFESGGTDIDSWTAFVDRIGAVAEYQATEPDYTYTMYLLNKQDKQLMLADKRSTDGTTVTVVSQFGPIGNVPRMATVIFMFP